MSRVKLRISRLAAREGVARLVHDRAQDVSQRDQPRVRGRIREEGFGPAGGSATARHSGQTTCDEICFSIDDKMLPCLLGASIVKLRDPESVAQRNPCQDGRAHGSTSREVCQAFHLLRQDEAAVDVEKVADRPQGVAGGGKLVIQRNSDAIAEDGHGWHQRPQQRARNHRSTGAERFTIERTAAGWVVMDADTCLGDSSAYARKRAKGDHKGAHSATMPCKHHAKGTCARGDKCRFSHK